MARNKIAPFVVCLMVFLAGCAPALSAGTEAPSTLVLPTEAKQPPAPAMTETPTASPTPTESGPKVGDQIIKDGITYTYTDVKSPDGKHEYLGYFGPVAVNLPFMNQKDAQYPALNPDGKTFAKNADGSIRYQVARDLVPTTVMVELGTLDGSSIKSITHPSVSLQQGTSTDYFGAFYADVIKHFLHTSSPTVDQLNLLGAALQRGDVTYTVSDGTTSYTLPISPDTQSIVYVINPANATKEKGFIDWSNPGTKHVFHSAFWGMEGHQAISLMASDTPLSQLTDQELLVFPLWFTSNAVDNPNVYAAGFTGAVQRDIQFAMKASPPQFVVNR